MQGKVNGVALCTIAALSFALYGCDSPIGGRKGETGSSVWSSEQKGSPAEPARRSGETGQLVRKAHDELAMGNVAPAFDAASTAVDMDPNNPGALFVYAEALAANGDVLSALRALDRSLIKGFADKKMIYQSRHLAGVRKSTGFKELMAKYGMAQEAR
jgi:hypothetical protein